MDAIKQLQAMGYEFAIGIDQTTGEDKLKFSYNGQGDPGERADRLFAVVSKDKPQALAFLRREFHQHYLLTKDPRPDLDAEFQDGLRWTECLLKPSLAIDSTLYTTLRAFRALGAVLTLLGKGTMGEAWVLRPVFNRPAPVLPGQIDNGGAIQWDNQEEYDKARAEFLVPYGKVIVGLLGRMVEKV